MSSSNDSSFSWSKVRHRYKPRSTYGFYYHFHALCLAIIIEKKNTTQQYERIKLATGIPTNDEAIGKLDELVTLMKEERL